MEKEMLVQLINKAKSGDQQAFEELLKEVHTPVSYQCRKMLDNEQDVEDATQEILLTIYTKLDTLEEPAAFYGWLGRITANQCKNALRKHKDLQFAEDEDGNSVLDDLEDLDERQIPDKALDNAETARMIDEIVSQLPEAQRMTTLLFYYNEMSIKQIAEAMDIKEDAVKARLFNARKTIKAKVQDYEKQGIKLYSVSVLPLLWYFLRKSAQAQASGEAAAACAAGVMGAGATAAVVGGSVAAGGTAAAAAATTAGTAVAGKIVAGIVAAALTIGGIGFAVTKLDDVPDTTKPSYEQTQGSTLVSTTAPTASSSSPTTPSLNNMAMEAYDALLRRGYTDNSMTIYYYANLDINHDGVNELIVADNKGTPDAWTTWELYTYDENGLVFCGSTQARYDYIYYVNSECLVGLTRAGNSYLTVSGFIHFDEPIETNEIIKLQETPYNAFDIGVTEEDILQIFYSAKDFYDIQIYGKRFLDSAYYSVSDFDWIEGVIEYNGCLYAPCDEYTYDEFVQKLHTLFSSDAVDRLISEVGLLDYNGKCYTYIREGAGDPILGNYEASAQLNGNVLFEIQISFTALDGSSVTEYIYCQQENNVWVLDGINFYGE